MFYSTSTEYIKEIMTQVPLDLIETLSLKIHSGVRFSYIFPSDVVIPKGRRQLLLKFGWRDLISKGLVERRLLDDVMVTTIFNEKQACVLFPDLKGKPDLNVMFYADHKEFREWCKDFFLYQWMKAGPFDEGKLKPEI